MSVYKGNKTNTWRVIYPLLSFSLPCSPFLLLLIQFLRGHYIHLLQSREQIMDAEPLQCHQRHLNYVLL